MPINKPEDFDKEKDIDERKPKPYRYLKNNELNEEDSINFDCDNTFTIMKTEKSKMKFDFDNPAILSNDKIIINNANDLTVFSITIPPFDWGGLVAIFLPVF